MDEIKQEYNRTAVVKVQDKKSGETRIMIDWTKLQKRANACKLEKDNQKCRREMADLGIQWID